MGTGPGTPRQFMKFAEWRNEDIQSLDALRLVQEPFGVSECETHKISSEPQTSPSAVCAKQRSPHPNFWGQRTKAQMQESELLFTPSTRGHPAQQEECLNTKAAQQSGHSSGLATR